MNRVHKFKEREEKEDGENILGEVSIYPRKQLSWHNSGYLNEDKEGKKFLRLYGKLIYEGTGVSDKENYLLKTTLGNFRLVKNEGENLLVERFLPSSSARVVPKSNL
ncbi:hypothetical protein KGY79_11170 [Candidatus Bipolaricaulota bacterium]|nr:hypothetical protein [Candidatus Bipolaricaulota bacterium]